MVLTQCAALMMGEKNTCVFLLFPEIFIVCFCSGSQNRTLLNIEREL